MPRKALSLVSAIVITATVTLVSQAFHTESFAGDSEGPSIWIDFAYGLCCAVPLVFAGFWNRNERFFLCATCSQPYEKVQTSCSRCGGAVGCISEIYKTQNPDRHRRNSRNGTHLQPRFARSSSRHTAYERQGRYRRVHSTSSRRHRSRFV